MPTLFIDDKRLAGTQERFLCEDKSVALWVIIVGDESGRTYESDM